MLAIHLMVLWVQVIPITPQHHATPHNTMQQHSTPHNTTQHHAIPRNTTQHHATPTQRPRITHATPERHCYRPTAGSTGGRVHSSTCYWATRLRRRAPTLTAWSEGGRESARERRGGRREIERASENEGITINSLARRTHRDKGTRRQTNLLTHIHKVTHKWTHNTNTHTHTLTHPHTPHTGRD